MRKISIVIPVYQAEKFIIEAIESCINQTYHNIEVVIVDDGCTDNSINLILPYLSDTRLKLIQHPCNLGTFAARKTGVLNCSGDNVLFLDPDDKLELHACEELAKYSDKDLVIFQMFNEKLNIKLPIQVNYDLTDNFTQLFFKNKNYIIYSAAGYLFKTSILVKSYAFLDFINERFIVAEDALLLLAAIQHIQTFYFINESLYFYRYNTISIMNEIDEKKIESKLAQYDLALKYITQVQKLTKNITFNKINKIIYHYIKRDKLATKYKNNQFMFILVLLPLYLKTYGVKRFTVTIIRKVLRIFK
ncbi:hypothetical protein CEP45_01720 [Mergibacter septicus]|uniref:glycosyltransferase family 2 protein n=1 Tax=Mergibacter septicus TaxID=221402 RepID=UPI001C7452F4|nr:glycosyltransferase family 2 protein [Mergibacter septicus]QDJ12633.1 hypothetical protein CEP45_01720 [Mergibacter septicus]